VVSAKKQQTYSGVALREQAQRFAAQADPKTEAERHEALFLNGINSAQDEFDWLIEHSAWIELGFASVADWWTTRIRPVMVRLDMRPTPEMVDKVLAKVREAELALPRAQRRTQRELASLALASDWRVRGRTETRNRRSAAGGDLEEPAEMDGADVADALAAAIEDVANNQTAAARAHATADEEPATPGPQTGQDSSAGHVDTSVVDVPGHPTDHREPHPGETDDAPASSGPSAPTGVSGADEATDSAGAEAAPSRPQLADEVEEQAPEGVPAPAPPHLGDPAALVAWFAELFEQVDVDVSGPLLTSDDFQLIDKSLGRIAGVVQLLVEWHKRAQR